ncbi:MAG: hypothetical protein V1792_25970 [Pseudomonadota bacterium]
MTKNKVVDTEKYQAKPDLFSKMSEVAPSTQLRDLGEIHRGEFQIVVDMIG